MTRNTIASLVSTLSAAIWLGATVVSAPGADTAISSGGRKVRVPHGQDRAPGPALSPADAIKKMQVPQGFHVELVAAEPDIINPVAMTFDERGRIWITESVEYPRKSAGPGRDRIKILEDTNGDGKIDKITVFAEGLNIPSGIAVGYGGVWVANSPDILFLQDTDGDGRADRREVVVTGFGRDDTHELPNSLNWGPDGWLYGLNGVFNRSHVRAGDKDFRFTCAMFRIHPRTREFQIFCEGTSNPWGIAWDDQGSAFVSACVVDHLWHLVETGYYHRQGGPYPPFTWKIGSIVDHKHQKAAYCGIHYFDSDAYPPEYRRRLYMGNIHGSCVNVDVLARDGSTYVGSPAADFLTANDAWFMPVSQKTGPDGSLYILDWYDRYHCYQDAGRDPRGIDRLKGRLYRVRYKETPRAGTFDLSRESDDALLARLANCPNDYYAATIDRLLCERRDPATRPKLEHLVLELRRPFTVRMRALWALVGSNPLDDAFHQAILAHSEPAYRAWGIRAAANARHVSEAVRRKIVLMAHDPSPDVRLQAAIAARKIDGIDAVSLLVDVLARTGDDKLVPHIVWNNLQPLMDDHGSEIARGLDVIHFERQPACAEFLPRAFERVLTSPTIDAAALQRLLAVALHCEQPEASRRCLQALAARVQSRELTGERLARVRSAVGPLVGSVVSLPANGRLFIDAALLAASWKDEIAIAAIRGLVTDSSVPEERRISALAALIAAGDPSVIGQVDAILAAGSKTLPRFRARVIASLGRVDSPRVADILLASYERLEPVLQPVAIELLTERVGWSRRLLAAIGQGKIPAHALNLSQVRKLLASGDKELAEQVRANWGTVRDQRSPEREQVIAQVRKLIRQSQGVAAEGEKVFKRICGQCHRIHGEGVELGPEITLNGRSSFDQLLSNVLDPNLVIGAAYRAVIVITKQGRTLTGLLAEDNSNRVVLRIQGGKTETVPRDDVEAVRVSNVSLMPEQIEKQLTPQELVDLFTFLSYDKHPSDPSARQLRGLR